MSALEDVIARVLSLRRELQGEFPPPLVPARVPETLHGLLRDVHALGASDEAVQGDIAEMLPDAYVEDLSDRLADRAVIIQDWLNIPRGTPPGYERVAFINTQMVVDLFFDLKASR